MKNAKKLLALLLAVAMCFGLFAGCTDNSADNTNSNPPEESTNQPNNTDPVSTDEPTDEIAGYTVPKEITPGTRTSTGTLVTSVEQGIEGKFSPFFYLSANDGNVVEMFTLYTLMSDRVANPVNNGIAGETRPYNGVDYTYNGTADVIVTENPEGYPEGYVAYDLTIRDDIYFTDGVQATIDDVIFGMYVTLDPTYDGNHTLYSVPIEGLDAYRSGMAILSDLLVEAGPDNTDFSQWDEATQNKFWTEGVNAAGPDFARSIVNYVMNNYLADYASYLGDYTPAEIGANDGLLVAFGMVMWGFGEPTEDGLFEDAAGKTYDFSAGEYPTDEDYWNAMAAAYEGDYVTLSDVEAADRSLWQCLPAEYGVGVETGSSADYVSGIIKTGDFSMRVVTTELDATAIYQMSLEIAPMHWYGDKNLYDYNAHSFGFHKGDLSIVKSKTSTPLGAGPYIFKEYSNGVVYMEANPDYYKGEPQVGELHFLESSEDSKVSGVVAGTLDIADPSYSVDKAHEIAKQNGFTAEEWENFDGPTLTTKLIDYRGYGYIGINPTLVMVGDDPYSAQSRALRKALATVISVYRDENIDSYYGTTASIINYPISNTSWAAPQSTDDGYKVAYSVGVDGADLYTASMTTEEKYAAAQAAALAYLEFAGYTVENGKVTAAPEGGQLAYTVNIGGNGSGDHPSFLLLKNAAACLEEIGMTLIVNDIANSNDLYATYQNGVAELWCAAWQASSDPDMFQLYHSQGSTNYYHIADADLDEIIMTARASTDQEYRKALYQAAMEIVMDVAVEIPIYQRSECVLVSTERVVVDSLPSDMTPFWGWGSEIESLAVK